MIVAQTTDITKGWIHDARAGWPQSHVQHYCVQDPDWQKIRLSMKGIDTKDKLAILLDWYTKQKAMAKANMDWVADERIECQVDNYLGALRRGGQLDKDNMIWKVR